MTRDGILEALEVLRRQAREQGLPALAEHLDEALLLALTEMANREDAGAHPTH